MGLGSTLSSAPKPSPSGGAALLPPAPMGQMPMNSQQSSPSVGTSLFQPVPPAPMGHMPMNSQQMPASNSGKSASAPSYGANAPARASASPVGPSSGYAPGQLQNKNTTTTPAIGAGTPNQGNAPVASQWSTMNALRGNQ